MTVDTITSTITTGISLDSGNYGDPLTITSTGSVTNTGDAIYGTTAWTIVNQGSIAGSGTGKGIYLQGGGAVTNGTGGSIAGSYGIKANGTTAIDNAGTIGATGTLGQGVDLLVGGAITNEVSGVVTGNLTGVAAHNGATVMNFGSIGGTGDGAQYSAGVTLLYGSTLFNHGAVNGDIGVYFSHGTNIVSNAAGGAITGTHFGVFGQAGDATIDNAGTIAGTGTGGTGVYLSNGGRIANHAGATIAGADRGIFGGTGPTTVDNAGVIAGTHKYGATLANGGVFTNESTGTVTGYYFGIGGSGENLSIRNAGTIQATYTGGIGADLSGHDSTLVNTGTIAGGNYGVRFSGQDATLENAGTIGASSEGGHAVYMNGSATNRLIVDAGAKFIGDVSATATAANTIELTSGAAIGTLSGLGSKYVGFQTVTIDSGASWDVAGSIAGFGGVTIQGFSARDKLDLTDVGTGDHVTLNGATDVLTVTDGTGGTVGTIQLAGDLTGYEFKLVGDGHGGAFLEDKLGTITGTVTTGVGLDGNVVDADPLTVAPTALVTGGGAYTFAGGFSTWTIVNQGTIEGGPKAGILLNSGLVSNAAGATITGGWYGVFMGANGTVDNAGTILKTDGYRGGAVCLNYGSTLTNQASGIISGPGIGVQAEGSDNTVVNFGSIYGAQYGAAVGFYSTLVNDGIVTGGTAVLTAYQTHVTNAAGAVISGTHYGAYMLDIGTIDNFGTIEATGTDGRGIAGGFSGTIRNEAGGTIAGVAYGVALGSDHSFLGNVTLENAGTIIGSSGHAVLLDGSTNNRLIVDAGAKFVGDVQSTGQGPGTIELTSGASAGTISGIGSQYRGFQTVKIDSGATWTVAGTEAGFNGTTIQGFGTHDTLDVTDLTFNGGDSVTLNGSDQLIVGNGSTVLETIQLAGSFTGDYFHLSADSGSGTFITENTTPCYCRGTRIRTPKGDVAVEALRIGDRVTIADGTALPIKWIGRRSYRDWMAVGNDDIQPVLFRADAIAEGIPARDLYVSPEHAMFIDGVLVPAWHLVNGVTIEQTQGVREIDYFHLEFDRHVVIFAEDAPAESFVDDDSRMLFHNAEEYRRLYPNEPRRQVEFCAPRVEDGIELAALRDTLAMNMSATASATTTPILNNGQHSALPI
jgi:hypothetical protein